MISQYIFPSKYLKFGKYLSYFGGAADVLSLALAFIPEDDTVKRTVLQIDSKVFSVSFSFFQQYL